MLDFEKKITQIDAKIEELKNFNDGKLSVNLEKEIKKLQEKRIQVTSKIYSSLTPW